MRAVLMRGTKSQNSVHISPFLKTQDRRAKTESNRDLSAYQPNDLPLGHTGSWSVQSAQCCFTSTQTGRGAKDTHVNFHTAPELSPVQFVQCCFASTKTVRTVRDGEPRTATSTFAQLLSSVPAQA